MNRAIRILASALTCLSREAAEPAREYCGLLAGGAGVITHVFPARNAAPNPATAYEIAPIDVFRIVREMREAGLELLGIYHSHPNGKNQPSPRDIESAYYPDVAYFIISPLPGAARPVRAFSIRDGRATELAIEVVDAKEDHDEST